MTLSFQSMAEYPRPAITGKQMIIVTNKTQLIVAVGCAMDFPGTTEITLVRECGKTFYVLDGAHDFRGSWNALIAS